jgi:hypothetical protein
VMRALALFLAAALVTACASVPNVPEQVIVPVERFKPLPTWATEPLPVPQPIDGTVEARIRSEAARGITIDLANCHRRLLAKLDKGETVDKQECERD